MLSANKSMKTPREEGANEEQAPKSISCLA